MDENTKDTKGLVGGSSAPAPAPLPAPEEARPIRETATAARQAPEITIDLQDELPDGAHIVEETIVRPPRAPNSQPPSSPPPTLYAPPSSLTPIAAHTSPHQEASAPLSSAASSGGFEKERDKIAAILKEIKLPERRATKKEKEPAVFDTALGATQKGAASPPLADSLSSTQVDKSAPILAESAQSAAHSASVESSGDANRTTEKTPGLVDGIVTPLRTLKNDLQKIIRVNKISLVKAVALESETRRDRESERERPHEKHSHRSLGIIFASLLFVLLGTAAFYGVFLIMGERSDAPAPLPQNDILFAENGVPFPLDDKPSLEIKRLLSQVRLGSGGTLGSITRIIPTLTEINTEGATRERSATLGEFLRALGTRAPDELLRALLDNFFFGIHTVDENAPHFVIPVLSYERAFAGMLRWEESMNADLSPAFTPIPDQTLGASGLPEKRRFEDVVMRNYDVRVLKDDAGTIELYYSFPTRKLLIIAESPYSFTEILSRLRAERKL